MGKPVNRQKWLGGPTSKERAYIHSYRGKCNTQEWGDLTEENVLENTKPFMWILCSFWGHHFFSLTCNENVSGSLNCSEIWGAHKRVKLCVGGDWQWKFGDEHNVGAEGKKHMWNTTERKCHRKNLGGSLLRRESEQHQKFCAFVQHLRKKKFH